MKMRVFAFLLLMATSFGPVQAQMQSDSILHDQMMRNNPDYGGMSPKDQAEVRSLVQSIEKDMSAKKAQTDRLLHLASKGEISEAQLYELWRKGQLLDEGQYGAIKKKIEEYEKSSASVEASQQPSNLKNNARVPTSAAGAIATLAAMFFDLPTLVIAIAAWPIATNLAARRNADIDKSSKQAKITRWVLFAALLLTAWLTIRISVPAIFMCLSENRC